MPARDDPPMPDRAPRSPAVRVVEVRFVGSIEPDMIAGLCADVRRLIEDTDAERLQCDLEGLTRSDLATVDALCRMRLAVLRLRCELALRNVPPELDALLAFVGLDGIARVTPGPETSGGRVRRQPEQREQGGGIEEEGDVDDAAVADLDDLQGPGLQLPVRAAGLVLPEGRRPVRQRRDEA